MPPTKPLPLSSLPSAVNCKLGEPTPPEFLGRFLATQAPALRALVEEFTSLTSHPTPVSEPMQESV